MRQLGKGPDRLHDGLAIDPVHRDPGARALGSQTQSETGQESVPIDDPAGRRRALFFGGKLGQSDRWHRAPFLRVRGWAILRPTHIRASTGLADWAGNRCNETVGFIPLRARKSQGCMR